MLNGIGGLASLRVGILSLLGIGQSVIQYPIFTNVTATLAIIIGTVTLIGSLVAAGKLHKLLSQKPIIWKKHSLIVNLSLLALFGVVIYSFFIQQGNSSLYSFAIVLIVSVLFSIIFGYAFAIRVGGADMPITISLLNSLSGVAGAIAGMAIGDILLVTVGGIVGASGLFLTQVMCKSMNRNLVEILTGKTSTVHNKERNIISFKDESIKISPENNLLDNDLDINKSKKNEEKKDVSTILKEAKSVIIVPGYGMALAQSQQLVKELADKLEENGADVKYAIHPVAGRMPGHMNVLLAEVDVTYEKLFEMEAVNGEFGKVDLVIVVGANDVLNPAARESKGTPIYGMPILNVDQAKEIIICNFDKNPGYAGVENPLYSRSQGVNMLLGDAKNTIKNLIEAM